MFLYCSKCGQEIEVDERETGRQQECPNCHNHFVVPNSKAKANDENGDKKTVYVFWGIIAAIIMFVFGYAVGGTASSSERPLTESECRNIQGNAWAPYWSDFREAKFSGSLYNGNEHTTLTEVDIELTFVQDGTKMPPRVYKYIDEIPPLSTREFSIDILPLPKDADYQWLIRSGKGRQK